MIGFSDTTYPTLCTPGTPQKTASPLIEQPRYPPDKRGLQLTPLWEHVVRTQSVPKDVNLDDVFMALNDRLRDPEWEVRQHALRVLVDVIPVMDDTLDQRMELLLGDLVGNLGHPGPAVRKGALDSLKVYLNHSSHADDILRNIVHRGVEKYAENQLQSDVVVGIILSLPSLIFPGKTNEDSIEYVVKVLIGKLVQVTFQEVSLRSLSKIRDMIGAAEFNKILEEFQPNSKRDFELLCQVYDTHGHGGEKWNDMNANIIHDNRWNSDTDSTKSQDEKTKDNDNNNENTPSGKVILETEIQFNSSTAVTMKILEEGESKSNDSDTDDDNRDCVVKVLSDSDNDDTFELRRRTPRRVRFGGEIVKLRTPDSDSNHHSDTDNDITITTTSNGDPDNPVIEIKFITDENRLRKSRSLIPIPVAPVSNKPKARSLPTSPNRDHTKSKLLYQSHPNLTRAHFFTKSRPKTNKLKLSIPKSPKKLKDTSTSPITSHREIELFHNLTRSPTRILSEPFNIIEPKKVEEAKQKSESRDVKKEEQTFTTDISDNDSTLGKTYSSFILKDSGSEGIQSDSFVPTADVGDCLTCSSSGSEGVTGDNNWESSGAIQKNVIEDMHDKDDWRNRLRGFETLQEELKKPEVLQKLQPYLSSFLHFLFNAERHPRLQATVEEILKSAITNSPTENIKVCLPQLAMSLSKMASPGGIRLGLATMKKTSAKSFVQHVMEEPIMSSRSAKCREGALQLVISATCSFPSTEFDAGWIATRTVQAAADRKRRIRQAALDVLANLAQLARPAPVLDAVTKASKEVQDGEQLVAAVRARLSRRQLPIVEADGSIINASPGVGQGADVEWVAAGSGSMSPCSARSRRRAMTPMASSAQTTRNESAAVTTRNNWSARRIQDPVDHFGSQVQHPENVTWALVPMGNKDEAHNKTYPGAQYWAVDQNIVNGEHRYNNGSSGSLRPLYVLQPTSPGVRPYYTAGGDGSDGRIAPQQRGRSSSPPVRLVQLKGTRPSRGQSSSPPEFGNDRRRQEGSPPRSNWRREFQSAIPVPVTSETTRARFRRRTRDVESERTSSAAHHQPMVALPPQHYKHSEGHYPYPQVGFGNGRTKSPSPTRFSVDKFNGNIPQDSAIHTSSSGSESSDYYTPPAEPYLPLQLQPSEPPASRNARDDSFEQSDRTDTPPGREIREEPPPPPPRERFINIEEDSVSVSTSDFEDDKKHSEEETDFVRNQVYNKLHEELKDIREQPFREKEGKRLSKSHADLSEVKRFTRKTINSAPPVKHLRDINKNENINNNNNTLDEVSKSSLNSSTSELKSQNDLTQSHLDLQSQTDLRSFTSSQSDMRSLRQSQPDLQSINNSQTSLQEEEKTVRYPEIVRKKSIPKKPDIKRRVSTIQKVPAVFPDTLRGFPKPREGLSEMVGLLESPEWEQSMRGLQSLVRLSRHHQETVEAQLHTVCVLLGRHIKNLRSQVARAACLAASEMFNIHKKALETELEELAVPLLHRTADTNKFLRADANAALDAMSSAISTSKVVAVLSTRGASHHNAVVRCASARLMADIVHRYSGSRIFQMGRDTRDRVLQVGANMLMEGSLETRKHAKNMFLELSNHPNFQRAMSEAVPSTTMRHISKILNNLK